MSLFSRVFPFFRLKSHFYLNFDFFKQKNPIFNKICCKFSSNVHYIDRDGNEKYMTDKEYPDDLEKKMKLLSYFKRYMTEHLVKAGGNSVRDAGDVVSRIPHLHTWFRTTCAVVMHLTNGSVQVSATSVFWFF